MSCASSATARTESMRPRSRGTAARSPAQATTLAFDCGTPARTTSRARSPATTTDCSRWRSRRTDKPPDGRTLANARAAGPVHLWDLTSDAPPRVLAGHHARVRALEFSPEGGYLATASDDLSLRLWDLARDRELTEQAGAVTAVRFSPDGATLVSAGEDGRLRLWDTASGDLKRVLSGHLGTVQAVVYGTRKAGRSEPRWSRVNRAGWRIRRTGDTRSTGRSAVRSGSRSACADLPPPSWTRSCRRRP